MVGEQVAARLNVHIGKPRFESNKRRIVHFERQMFFYGSAYGLRPRGYATHRISGSVVLSDINSSLCTNTCLRAHTRYAHIRMYTYRYYSCSLYRFIRTYIDDNADGRKNTNRVSGNACTRMGIFWFYNSDFVSRPSYFFRPTLKRGKLLTVRQLRPKNAASIYVVKERHISFTRYYRHLCADPRRNLHLTDRAIRIVHAKS